MGFSGDVARFAAMVKDRNRRAFVGSSTRVHGSVTNGDPITGAPGQPVDTGDLLNSWQLEFTEEWVARVTTAKEYAEAIEEGIQEAYEVPETSVRAHTREDGTAVRAHTRSGYRVERRHIRLRSEVGGFHSVKLTRAGWQPLVDDVVREVRGAG